MIPEKVFLTPVKSGPKSSSLMMTYEKKSEEDFEYIRKDIIVEMIKKKVKQIKAILADDDFSFEDLPPVILQQRGRFRGNVDVRGTLRSMAIGESKRFDINVVAPRTIYNAVSNFNTDASGRKYTTIGPGINEPYTTVKRLK